MYTHNMHQPDDFGCADDIIDHYLRLTNGNTQEVKNLLDQHAVLSGFASADDYTAFLDSTANQIPQLTFAFSGREVDEITVEYINTNGDITVEATSYERDLNKAVGLCLESPRWGGSIFTDRVFDVVEGLLPYLSDEHYARNPKLLANRNNWTAENLYFDAAFKQVVGEHNSAYFSFEVTKWISSSADLAFPESTNPIKQMADFSDQLLGNAAALALDVMMGYLRNDTKVVITSPDELRKALLSLLVDGNRPRVAIPMVTGLYLSFLSTPMEDGQAENMVTALTKDADKRAADLKLVHSADTIVKH